jgi:shikimate dehydrogenase
MRRFGLIGYPLGHSFSGRHFAEKFSREGLDDCRYDLFPLTDVSALPSLISDTPGLEGLNVTIPYKELVIPLIDELDPVAAGIGACNCLKISGGRIKGFNTDAAGFFRSLEPHLRRHHRAALVLGTGGASKAVCHVLRELGIEYRLVGRNPEGPLTIGYGEVAESGLERHTLIVNTTPIGMHPHLEEAPPIPYSTLTSRHLLYDLVYNPPVTRFMELGMERGATVVNGTEMLFIQAEESWRIWNDESL